MSTVIAPSRPPMSGSIPAESERYEIWELGAYDGRRRCRRLLATAGTLADAHLAVRTLREEGTTGALAIRDAASRRWLERTVGR